MNDRKVNTGIKGGYPREYSEKVLAKVYEFILSWPEPNMKNADPVSHLGREATESASCAPNSNESEHYESTTPGLSCFAPKVLAKSEETPTVGEVSDCGDAKNGNNTSRSK